MLLVLDHNPNKQKKACSTVVKRRHDASLAKMKSKELFFLLLHVGALLGFSVWVFARTMLWPFSAGLAFQRLNGKELGWVILWVFEERVMSRKYFVEDSLSVDVPSLLVCWWLSATLPSGLEFHAVWIELKLTHSSQFFVEDDTSAIFLRKFEYRFSGLPVTMFCFAMQSRDDKSEAQLQQLEWAQWWMVAMATLLQASTALSANSNVTSLKTPQLYFGVSLSQPPSEWQQPVFEHFFIRESIYLQSGFSVRPKISSFKKKR